MSNTKEVHLIVKEGYLYIPSESIDDSTVKEFYLGLGHSAAIVVCIHPEGDCDTIAWPNPNLEHLRSAIADARETGLLSSAAHVFLPDGKEVE